MQTKFQHTSDGKLETRKLYTFHRNNTIKGTRIYFRLIRPPTCTVHFIKERDVGDGT
jgi:hypothetical protein